MRNLKLQHCTHISKVVPDVRFMLLDPNTKSSEHHIIYLATADKLHAYNTVSGCVEELAELPGIIGCEYLALDNEICVATTVGEVLLINPLTKETTEGTFCDVGIERMAWSPDQEVVAFVTSTHNVVVMTCTYDPLTEHPLADQFFGEGQFITVGWGKKETQFHGSEGKSAAKKKNDFKPPEQVEALMQDIEITWRADGAYFAVSYVNILVGRVFKVFDKEGRLEYTSEKCNGLQPPIAWRPLGTWLAMPQQMPNKSTVALFEKNGLRHREIVLPFSIDEEPVQALKWSLDSDILSIETKNIEAGSNNLYLYTIGNYHWYLKQVLDFKLDDPIAFFSWDCRIGEEKTLHVLLKSGQYLVYTWQFSIDKYERSGIVAVIDGKRLLITDFSKSVVPPPMCSKELELEANINACGFMSYNKEELLLFAYDVAQTIHIFTNSVDERLCFTKILTLAQDTNLPREPLAIGNMIWYNDQYLIATATAQSTSTIYYISVQSKPNVYTMQSSLQLAGTVNALARGSVKLDQFFMQTIDGKIHQVFINEDNTLRIGKMYAQLGQGAANHLQWFASRDLDNTGLISLRTNQSLCIDARCIAGDVTSFCMAGNYLAYTKLTALYFLRVSDQVLVCERKIERGGKLVTTTYNTARTVLQMPRGNLEAICPRVLALEIVGDMLDRKRYNAAMDMLRKQRINLNIFCDHNLNDFVENLDVFLWEIENSNWLNLFLSDLQNEDFTKTMYASNYKEGSQIYPNNFKIEQKVFYLCERLCDLMEKSNESRFRLPIITAYVKIGQVEKALDIIWQEKQRESSTQIESNHSEEALKYLLYLVDVNQLYNVALGTYDFGLVLFVAQKSQKDPKEFLTFLNELKSYELNYRKFKIDEHLKRYEKALYNIAQCGETRFNEALEFIKRHVLFQKALCCFQQQRECYQQICLAFADHLRANGKLEDASLMYERGNNLSQALLSAKHVLDWQRTMVLAKQNGDNLESVALSLVPSLQENGKHSEAFELLKTYGNDFADALNYLLRGKCFLKAIFEVRMQEEGVQDLIASVITPDILSYTNSLDKNIADALDLFISHKHRLLSIREKKAKQKELNGENFDDEADVDECDLLSDTSSMNSSRYTASSRGSTGKTFRSSKNRRKHERKLLSLKPGNPFEDIALIDALYNHITKVFAQQQHFRDTCKALIELQQDNVASAIQQRFKHLLTSIKESLDEIWTPEIMTTQQFLTGPNIDYTQLQNEQRYAMINPQKRFKPQLTIIDWEFEILR